MANERKSDETKQPRGTDETFRTRRRWLGAILIFSAAVGLTGLSRLPKREKDKPPAKSSKVNVVVQTVVAEDFRDTIDLPGVVEPNQTVVVSARVAGQVVGIKGREGRPCKRTDTIVVLDTVKLSARLQQADAMVKRLTAQIAQAQAERDLARLDVDSTTDMLAKGAATKLTLDQATVRLRGAEAGITQVRSGLVEAQASRAAAEADVGYATIATPIDGVLDKVMFEPGEYVAAGDPVARIVDIATMRVVVDVPQRDIGCVKLGQEHAVLCDMEAGAYGRTLKGTVDYIAQLADPGAKTTRVEVLVSDPSHGLRSGRPVRLRLHRRTVGKAIMVPLEAVIQLERGRAVYIMQDGKAVRREVTLGLWRGRRVRILPDARKGWGLEAGDELIVKGHRYVGPGQEVKIGTDPATSRPASGPAPSVPSSSSARLGRP